MDKFLLYSDERTLDTYLHGHFLLWIMGKFKNRQLHYIACITSIWNGMHARQGYFIEKCLSTTNSISNVTSSINYMTVIPNHTKPLLQNSNILLKKNLDVTVLYINFKWKIILRHLVQSLLTTECLIFFHRWIIIWIKIYGVFLYSRHFFEVNDGYF